MFLITVDVLPPLKIITLEIFTSNTQCEFAIGCISYTALFFHIHFFKHIISVFDIICTNTFQSHMETPNKLSRQYKLLQQQKKRYNNALDLYPLKNLHCLIHYIKRKRQVNCQEVFFSELQNFTRNSVYRETWEQLVAQTGVPGESLSAACV